MHIGLVSTRFHGTDGVSLEAAKWAQVLEADLGHECFWFAGKLDTPPARSHLCEKAFFDHPEIIPLQRALFGHSGARPHWLGEAVDALTAEIKTELSAFIAGHGIDLLLPQNIMAIPMHVPLGLAVTELAEAGMPMLAHHHDFAWERARFAQSCAADYLDRAFPPPLDKTFQHVVINSQAGRDLAERRSVPSTVVPNVFDFENPPPAADRYGEDFRSEFGIAEDEVLVLQPTRVVPRKGIEFAIELCGRMASSSGRPVCLVVSHLAGDEGFEYYDSLKRLATQLGVRVLWLGDRVGEERGDDAAGNKLYKLWDVYPHADLVTYPSLYEGFGNALLETFYFSKPVVINRYPVYVDDIEPHGFQLVAMDGAVTDSVVDAAIRLVEDRDLADRWAAHNYGLCLEHYSYRALRQKLGKLVDEAFPV
jgi:glycosyltransferase involved in cell wall biosynthesis